MNSIIMGSICFGCILSGTALGFYFGRSLPKHHLDSDSKDTIKMAWGTIATMSALVLSLLLASAKGSFDTVTSENNQAATNIIILNRTLAEYGPETKTVRNELKNDVAATITKIWPEKTSNASATTELTGGNGIEHVQDELSQLTPSKPDSQRILLGKAPAALRQYFAKRVGWSWNNRAMACRILFF